jgi:hypothetical protein
MPASRLRFYNEDDYVESLVAAGGFDRLSERLTRTGHVVCLPVIRFRPPPAPDHFALGRAIMERCAADHGMPVSSMIAAGKTQRYMIARLDCMTRLRAVTVNGKPRFSLPQIGRMLGGRDHTTILSGLRRWAEINAMREAAE